MSVSTPTARSGATNRSPKVWFRAVRPRSFTTSTVPIVAAALGPHAGVIGALLVALNIEEIA